VAAEVHRRLAGRHLLLLTDFDGTLSPLAATPADAIVPPDVRTALDLVSASWSTTVGVVSGRRRADVAARVGDAPAFVAGLHGLEIAGPNVAFHHQALDEVAPVIASINAIARRSLVWCPGVVLEDKTYALTCHVRLAPPECAERALDEFEAVAEPQLEARVLKLLTAAQALELLPAVTWHKGKAAEWIRARVATRVNGPVSVVYLGDDRTDEDAFDVLTTNDVAIGVGDRPHTHLIDHRLAGPDAVGQFFDALAVERGT
jgi:trehalose-phosphatase